ncbi:hypothetical protein [Marinilabilia rubra]|uniref:Uncharacterized protein n=1 Tax=Marinilabilia rubra TaxID=2162893 RepID=A0A2U2B9Y3_9BACT|nr:hypothetical protein [Marinilabilia rubra]PWD99853.1 hypothetical protein DDZ16_08135 [Marinilabilia rubra]
MVRFEKTYCAERLFDRDFLYGVFANSGFVKDPEEFLRTSGECTCIDRECDGDKNQNTDEDSQCIY